MAGVRQPDRVLTRVSGLRPDPLRHLLPVHRHLAGGGDAEADLEEQWVSAVIQ